MKLLILTAIVFLAYMGSTDAFWHTRDSARTYTRSGRGVSGDVTLSVTWSRRTRSNRDLSSEGAHFSVSLRADSCDFDIYDENGDEVIVESEMYDIFGNTESAMKLFKALDYSKDGVVDEEEFYDMLPATIKGCDER